MELLYLWIKKIGTIQEQGFNFGGKYLFEFKSEKQQLIISENEQYIEGFFDISDKDNISNVTAIVGANGSGKTLLLDFIKYYISSNVEEECIIVCRDHKGIHISYPQKNMTAFLIKHDLKKINIEIKDNTADINMLISRFKESPLSNTDLIYFSNIFDSRIENSSDKLHNISTNYLIKNYKKKYIENELFERSVNQTDMFDISEIENQLFFINENPIMVSYIAIDFIPKELEVSCKFDYLNKTHFNKLDNYINNTDIFIFLSEVKISFEKTTLSREKDITKQKTEKGFSMSTMRHINRYKLQFNLVAHFIFEMFHYPIQDIDKEKLKEIDIKYNKNNDFTQNLKNLLQELKNNNYWNSDKVNRIDCIIRLCEIINSNEVFDGGINDCLILLYTDRKTTKEFIQCYKRSFSFSGNCKLKWRNMSSGEIAYLNLYSRFYSIKDKLENNDVIILMDEPELYMHPHWQQKFLNRFLSFIGDAYSLNSKGEQRNIQIILTSNEPIVASDLSNNNIIYLKKKKFQDVEVSRELNSGVIETEKKLMTQSIQSKGKHTFGANIHTLLADTFFLENGFIGDFARENIQDLLYWLNYDKECKRKKNYIRKDTWYDKNAKKLIEFVGDEVVKTKLKEMLKLKREK